MAKAIELRPAIIERSRGLEKNQANSCEIRKWARDRGAEGDGCANLWAEKLRQLSQGEKGAA
ncbi:hypothetical protein, partial [Sulfitobacter sp. 15WGC]|uniref:hypothetical protein n=1 Tax=Sulfitobacter sp. 15WGC TaxID=2575437 RepID=UPI001B7F87D8